MVSHRSNPKKWKVISRFVQIRSPWLTLIGEKLQTHENTELEYWRVEKPDGVIVLTLQGDKILLPVPMYRPGIGEYTLDFCGGRMAPKTKPTEAALQAVQRELKITDSKPFSSLTPLNNVPWEIDSSFTDVRLYSFVAMLSPDVIIKTENIGATYPITKAGVAQLLKKLTCLQCRACLQEWLSNSPL